MTLDTCVALIAILVILLLETMAWYRELGKAEKRMRECLEAQMSALESLTKAVKREEMAIIALRKRVKELEGKDGTK